MTPVIDGVRRVRRGLENNTCLDFARRRILITVFFLVSERVVTGLSACEARGRRSRGRLELPRALPLWAAREPQHKPVIRVVFLREMSSEEESCETVVS